ncbi:MAG: hypothetical protein AAFN74_10310, partial [Myxococcota bacterium]
IVVETEIPSVCLTERDIVVTVPMDIVEAALPNILGVPSIPPGFLDADIMSIMTPEQLALLPTISVQETFTPEGLDAIPSAIDDVGAQGALRLLDVVVGGSADMFAGIERVAVTLVPGDPNLGGPVELAVCSVAAGCDVSMDQIQLTTDRERDLLPLLNDPSATLQVDIVAKPTVTSWNLNVDVCMTGEARLTVSP